jgi:hypothetical protein
MPPYPPMPEWMTELTSVIANAIKRGEPEWMIAQRGFDTLRALGQPAYHHGDYLVLGDAGQPWPIHKAGVWLPIPPQEGGAKPTMADMPPQPERSRSFSPSPWPPEDDHGA